MKTASDINSLLGTMDGVPYMREPFYWDRRLTVSANVNAIKGMMWKYVGMLPDPVGGFDEAAIMVPNEAAREHLVRDLMLAGWKVFNRAADLVFTNPFGTRYTVEYVFLKHPQQDWRLEVMLLDRPTKVRDGLTGFSPLHQALWYPNGINPSWEQHAELPVPHLSFKVASYAKVVQHMQDKHFIPAQVCQSSYGQFGYWLHQDATRQLYIKPRANTRDTK